MDSTGIRDCDGEEGLREEPGEGICQLEKKSRDCVGHEVSRDCEMMTYSKGGMHCTLDPRGDLVSRLGRPDTPITEQLSTQIEPRVFWHHRV